MWDFIERVVKDIEMGRVMGSTEVVEHVLNAFRVIINKSSSMEEMVSYLEGLAMRSVVARPTSAMLTNYMRAVFEKIEDEVLKGISFKSIKEDISEFTLKITDELKKYQKNVAEMASRRISNSDVIITISYSTSVLKSIEYAVRNYNKSIKVIVTESRPRNEGVHLAEKLDDLGVETTLIVDSAMNYFIKDATKAFVGAEAIAANGAVVNKVGTSLLALISKYARVPFYVVAGTYKFSIDTVFGELIELPLGKREELISKERISEMGEPEVYVPLMDVTPPEYITAIITEKGIIAPQAVPLILKEIYGKWPPELRSLKEVISNVLRRMR